MLCMWQGKLNFKFGKAFIGAIQLDNKLAAKWLHCLLFYGE